MVERLSAPPLLTWVGMITTAAFHRRSRNSLLENRDDSSCYRHSCSYGASPSELHFVLCSVGSYLPLKRDLEL